MAHLEATDNRILIRGFIPVFDPLVFIDNLQSFVQFSQFPRFSVVLPVAARGVWMALTRGLGPFSSPHFPRRERESLEDSIISNQSICLEIIETKIR